MYSSVFRYTNTWIGHASRLSAALKWRPLRLGPRMCYCSSQQQPSTCCSQSDSWGPGESNEIEWFCFWIHTVLTVFIPLFQMSFQGLPNWSFMQWNRAKNAWNNTAGTVIVLEMQRYTVQVFQEGYENLIISTSWFEGY